MSLSVNRYESPFHWSVLCGKVPDIKKEGLLGKHNHSDISLWQCHTNSCLLASGGSGESRVTWPTVLVSAGIIFFLVAGIVLCFGFQMRRILITRWCLNCCWAALNAKRRSFQLLVLPCQLRLAVHRKLRGGTARVANPNCPKQYSWAWGRRTNQTKFITDLLFITGL